MAKLLKNNGNASCVAVTLMHSPREVKYYFVGISAKILFTLTKLSNLQIIHHQILVSGDFVNVYGLCDNYFLC